jgi:dimethylglycine dehydrogenase
MVGRTTSGAYGYSIGKSLAVACVDADKAAPGAQMQIQMLGKRHQAIVIPDSPWDPENARLRA